MVFTKNKLLKKLNSSNFLQKYACITGRTLCRFFHFLEKATDSLLTLTSNFF